MKLPKGSMGIVAAATGMDGHFKVSFSLSTLTWWALLLSVVAAIMLTLRAFNADI